MRADMLASEMQQLLRLAAEPVAPGELIIEQIRRAARRCSLTFSRAKKLWYAECRVSGVDFVSIASAIAKSNDSLVAYQNARATLLSERRAEARRK